LPGLHGYFSYVEVYKVVPGSNIYAVFLFHVIHSAALFEQVSNGTVSASGFCCQAYFAGAVGRNSLAAIRRKFFIYFAQRMHVEFRHNKSAITAKSAAFNASRFDEIFDARRDHMPQLGIGSRVF
jgi:hypothetical protein